MQNSYHITLKLQKFCKYSFKLSTLNSVFHMPQSFMKCIYIHTCLPAAKKTEDRKIQTLLRDRVPLHKLMQIMDASLLLPPPTVRGMTELDREAFQKKVMIPYVIVKSSRVQCAVKCLKKYMLKLENIKPVQCEVDLEKKVLLLNPLLVSKYEDIKDEFLLAYGSDDAVFEYKEITLQYENWKAMEILKAVLPENQEGAHSYSIIGHILHVNLRDHMVPYKSLIGQVYLDKIRNISLVINKAKNIESTYRNFQMEVLAGTGDTNVMVREAGCTFTMDFAKVYWNPRLSTEHERIVKKLKHGDVLYDVMAGIGPFAIPAGKKKCYVLANDLNPSSYEALVQNCSINKVKERVQCFNLDGHEFIKTVLKKDLLEKWKDPSFCGKVHVTMNLPAMAVEFLPSFIGLYHNTDHLPHNPTLPLVHVYMFTKEENEDIAVGMVAEQLGYLDSKELDLITEDSIVSSAEDAPNNTEVKVHYQEDEPPQKDVSTQEVIKNENRGKSEFGGLQKHVNEVSFVRQVAPNKAMMRVSLQLPWDLLVRDPDQCEEPPCKKVKAP